jgi:putative hydrolase of the HAD superfamily
MSRFDVIAFDADDTLWHNERLYVATQGRFRALLGEYLDSAVIDARLYATEMRNLQHFGYGIKAFALSMIETAVELTEGRIEGRDVQRLIDMAREMLAADIELLDHAAETIARLSMTHPLMLITKGDLRDQEAKVARSGLSHYFRQIEIVSDKTPESYLALLHRHDIVAARFLMVGNSLRSDVLPVLALGASAVYVPHHLTWVHEVVPPPPAGHPGYYCLEDLGGLPSLIQQLEQAFV